MQDNLHTLLSTWQVRVDPEADFVSEVWRRIASENHSPAHQIWNRMEVLLTQPAWAAAAMFVLLLAGLGTGDLWRQHVERRVRVAGAAAYVLAVDPVLHAATHQP